MKNCLEEYLTEKCANCPFWADGTDNRGIGCVIPAPIMYCPYFAKMFNEQETQRKMEKVLPCC